jgi:hypothetical protein
MNKKGIYIGTGLSVGLLVGIFTDNIGLWISLGLVFGVVFENHFDESGKD